MVGRAAVKSVLKARLRQSGSRAFARGLFFRGLKPAPTSVSGELLLRTRGKTQVARCG